jgi:pyruvate,water dikinase
MNAMIMQLEEIGRQDVSRAGGKGANLGELMRHAFPIPPGFVITADACRRFFETIALDGMYRDLNHSGSNELAAHCKKIQRKILQADMPPHLSKKIFLAHGALLTKRGNDIVCAVRSSATAEDLGDASFAGQHATYYYVSKERLLSMVKHCWASLWNPEAAIYRFTHGIDHASVWMAVVVQKMILSDISGITFTANPVSGSTDEIVTESCWGMGAAIVDGRVTPDHYVLEKKGLTTRERRIAEKRFMVPSQIAATAGTRLQEVPHAMREKETLTPDLVEMVARWALKAENHFGSLQDVEWAIAGGEYFMLQSRPITVMGPQETGRRIQGKHVIFKPLFENFTDPITPLTGDCFQFLFTPPLMRLINGRLYVNLKLFQALLPLKLPDGDLADFLYDFGVKTPEMKISLVKLPFFLCFLLVAYFVVGVGFARTRPLPADFMDAYRKLASRVDLDENYDILKSLRRLLWWPRLLEPIGNLVLLVNLSAPRYIFYLGLLKKLLMRWLPDLQDDAAALLCSGGENVLSVEMGREIWSLAQAAKSHPVVHGLLKKTKPAALLSMLANEPEAAEFMDRLAAFLAKNGHRGLKELELRSPRWEENPAPVLGMIRNYMLMDSDPAAQESAVARERLDLQRRIQKGLEAFPLEKSTRWRRRMLQHVAGRAKYFARMRENSRFYHIMGFYVIRKKIRRIEKAFIDQGKLKCMDDIFFLHLKEIADMKAGRIGWQDVEARIRKRRMEHIRLSRMTPPKFIGIKAKHVIPPESGSDEPGALLHGQPASPGTYEGTARIILDPSVDVELKPGEIMVAPFTDPAWTPLFLTAGAAVVEVGSYLSHAGTVAREFGMPCVVDLPACTTSIQTGARLVVDGDRGTVRVLKDTQKGKT